MVCSIHAALVWCNVCLSEILPCSVLFAVLCQAAAKPLCELGTNQDSTGIAWARNSLLRGRGAGTSPGASCAACCAEQATSAAEATTNSTSCPDVHSSQTHACFVAGCRWCLFWNMLQIVQIRRLVVVDMITSSRIYSEH
jgi:hypothetical protein